MGPPQSAANVPIMAMKCAPRGEMGIPLQVWPPCQGSVIWLRGTQQQKDGRYCLMMAIMAMMVLFINTRLIGLSTPQTNKNKKVVSR